MIPFDRQSVVSLIQQARERISGFVVKTPLIPIADEARAFGTHHVYLKLENLQTTGSFKARGASNKVFSFTAEEAARGVVTSSTGNHGLGVSAAAQHRGIDAEVFVAPQVAPEKYARMQEHGARIRQVGQNPLEAELAARSAANDSGRTYVPPYNDPLVIAGQGTIALELLEQTSRIDAIYIAVGGGGLISGMGSYLKAISPRTEVVGCWPENSRVMYESLHAGHIIEYPESSTLSESTAGGIEPGSITFALCRQVIDKHVLVSESEILKAMRWAKAKGWILEGAAGVAIAGAWKEAQSHAEKQIVILCCGGNLSPKVAKEMQ